MPEFVRKIPTGDNRERSVCAACGHVDYQNPKVVVGAVVADEGRVLLCRRAIEPRAGFWTLPAGFMELGESAEDGARREVMEEAEAEIAIDGILAVYTIKRIGQVQVLFRAGFAAGVGAASRFAAGPESLEVRLFPWDEIPWESLAFPSVSWALRAWQRGAAAPLGAPSVNPFGSDDRFDVPPGFYPAEFPSFQREGAIGVPA